MDKFNTITDPETGNNIDINDPKAMSILQKYSDISGRTRQINKEFFKFREFEFNQVNNVVYPFLIKIIAKEKVPDYINSHLNCEINQNHTPSTSIFAFSNTLNVPETMFISTNFGIISGIPLSR